jgi:nucleoside phosphorylase
VGLNRSSWGRLIPRVSALPGRVGRGGAIFGRALTARPPIVRGRKGIARVAILTFIDAEARAIRESFGLQQQMSGTSYFTSVDDGLAVVTMKTADRTNLGVTNGVSRLIEDLQPELLMIAGIAGGIRDAHRNEVEPGDVVLADYLHYTEYMKYSEEAGEQVKYIAMDQPSARHRATYADPVRLVDRWQVSIPVPRPVPGNTAVYPGSLIAGEKLLGDPTNPKQKEILERYPDALAVDMESAGVGRAIHESRFDVRYNPAFLVIRGISDLSRVEPAPNSADETILVTNQVERDLWRPYAAAAAAAFALAVASAVLQSPDLRERARRADRGIRRRKP